MIGHHGGLLAADHIDPDARVLWRLQPRQPHVTVAITPPQAGTVIYGRLAYCCFLSSQPGVAARLRDEEAGADRGSVASHVRDEFADSN